MTAPRTTDPSFDADLAERALARSPLFHGMRPEDLQRLALGMVQRRYRRNEVIFHEGDPGDSLHVVVDGRIKITRESAGGDEAIVATLGPGDTFGELVLLDGAVRSASATAMEPTETLTMTRTAFSSLVDGSDRFRWQLLGGIAHRLRRLTDQLAEVHFLDLTGRVALQLTRLAEEASPGRLADIPLRPTLTQSDLAAMVGGTRQRVNQILGDFAADGLVAHEAGRLIVRDLERLRGRGGW
jgi:CRP/FNR family transcriptional regulator, cyclic AMP receptor protein